MKANLQCLDACIFDRDGVSSHIGPSGRTMTVGSRAGSLRSGICTVEERAIAPMRNPGKVSRAQPRKYHSPRLPMSSHGPWRGVFAPRPASAAPKRSLTFRIHMVTCRLGGCGRRGADVTDVTDVTGVTVSCATATGGLVARRSGSGGSPPGRCCCGCRRSPASRRSSPWRSAGCNGGRGGSAGRLPPGRVIVAAGTAATMAVTIDAPPDQVWPRPVQTGWDCAG